MYHKFRPYSIWWYTVILLIFWMIFSTHQHQEYKVFGFPFLIDDKVDLVKYLVVLLVLYQFYKWWDAKLYSELLTWITVGAVLLSLAVTFIYNHGYEVGEYVTRTTILFRGERPSNYRVYVLPHTPFIVSFNVASLGLYIFNVAWKGLLQDRLAEQALQRKLDEPLKSKTHRKKRHGH
ncbi:MAG: hypothetical protein JO154_05800 [Chitinophaga sp.]|uniref:hypothetical protein n=1 Tax=Chitinophaga sp. TaxID=1869181 RepID=UPI0025C38310|nr:hypothetical protein [Chitinophaga sp.]MBV8252103.1 hypothetical protein [Chitinophaga sp.]